MSQLQQDPSAPSTEGGANPSSNRSWKLLALVFTVNLLSGIYVGYSIGFPAVFMAYNQLATDCSSFHTERACVASVAFASSSTLGSAYECQWDPVAAVCGYADRMNCTAFHGDSNGCGSLLDATTGAPVCTYDTTTKDCTHIHGWSATQQGLFASSMVIGGTLGCFPVGIIMDRIGRKKSFVLLGLTSTIACLLMHGACAISYQRGPALGFTLLLIANILAGAPLGSTQVLSPMYVGEMAPPKLAFQAGIAIQVGITFGIFLMGVYGFVVKPDDAEVALGTATSFQTYFQVSIAGLTVLSAMMSVIGFVVPESRHYLRLVEERDEKRRRAALVGGETEHLLPAATDLPTDYAAVDAGDDGEAVDDAHNFAKYADKMPFSADDAFHVSSTSLVARVYRRVVNHDDSESNGNRSSDVVSIRKIHVLCLIVATALSACLSLTGINSFIVYAPVIMQSAGMSSLVGNLLVDGWNFVTTLVAIPLAFKCNTTQMFNAGAVLVTITCCISGVLVFPGVIENDATRDALLGTAVFLFIAAFEIGMATAYYVIAQAMFPKDSRSFGTGYTVGIQYLFNIIIDFAYPLGLQAFSPAGGSTQRGMAVWLLLYGVVGIVTTGVLLKYLSVAQYIAHTF